MPNDLTTKTENLKTLIQKEKQKYEKGDCTTSVFRIKYKNSELIYACKEPLRTAIINHKKAIEDVGKTSFDMETVNNDYKTKLKNVNASIKALEEAARVAAAKAAEEEARVAAAKAAARVAAEAEEEEEAKAAQATAAAVPLIPVSLGGKRRRRPTKRGRRKSLRRRKTVRKRLARRKE